jgi:Mediator complex subunit 25 PTOV activation and synapsin 2
MVAGMASRERIWRGTLEWNDKQNQQNTTRQVQCEIYASVSKETNEVEVRGDSWPIRLIMQLMPRAVITNVGGHLLRVSLRTLKKKLSLKSNFNFRTPKS